MKLTIKIAMLAFSCFSLLGCSTWSTSGIKPATGDSQVRSAKKTVSSDKVSIIESDITDRKYQVLGDVEATVNKTTAFNKSPTKDQVNAKLQQEAAKIGADAVIMVRYGDLGPSFFSWGSLNGKGRAIAYND